MLEPPTGLASLVSRTRPGRDHARSRSYDWDRAESDRRIQGLSVASAPGIPGTTDLTALGSIVSAVEGGTLGVNEMVNVLTGVTQVAGFTHRVR